MPPARLRARRGSARSGRCESSARRAGSRPSGEATVQAWRTGRAAGRGARPRRRSLQAPGAESCVPATCQRFASSRTAVAVRRREPRAKVIDDPAHGARRGAQRVEDRRRDEVLPGPVGCGREIDEEVVGLSRGERSACDRARRRGELRPASGSAREQQRSGGEDADRPDRLGAQETATKAAHGAGRSRPRSPRPPVTASRASLPTSDQPYVVESRASGLVDLQTGAVEARDDQHAAR